VVVPENATAVPFDETMYGLGLLLMFALNVNVTLTVDPRAIEAGTPLIAQFIGSYTVKFEEYGLEFIASPVDVEVIPV
jgi:hypothetical protein